MPKKNLSKIKKSLYAIPFEDDIQHTRHKANGGKGKRDILIQNIPFLFTCDETDKLQCLQNYSIVISDGIIREVVPARKANPGRYNLVYEAGMRGGIVVTPGLINAHSHPPMYLMRSAMMLDEGESIDETIAAMPKWERTMTDDDYTFSAIGDITEQQKAGITTTLSHFAVYWPIELAARATKHNIINAVSVASNSHPENSPELIREILKKRENLSESQLAIALHYVHRASAKILKEIKELSEKHNLLFTCHMAESEKVAKKCEALHGRREVEMLEKYGLLTKHTIASHSIYVTDNEIKKLVKNKVGIVHLQLTFQSHWSSLFWFLLI